jgi:hypothetical protein
MTAAVSARPVSPCPDHPGSALVPFPGGGARGSCPVDGRSYQMSAPEFRPAPAALPAVYRLAERTEADGLYRDYRNDSGQTVTVKATGPAGLVPEPETARTAALQFAGATRRNRS